jgi:chaperone modulatory protein CbpM
MTDDKLREPVECGPDDPLTPEAVAEAIGARPTLVLRLVRQGLLEAVPGAAGETLLPSQTVVQLRRMLRLRRDLRVNFTGAAIILELVERIESLSRRR